MHEQVLLSKYRAKRRLYDVNLRDHETTHTTHAAHFAFLRMLLQEAYEYRKSRFPNAPKSKFLQTAKAAIEKMQSGYVDGGLYAESLNLIAVDQPWQRH